MMDVEQRCERKPYGVAPFAEFSTSSTGIRKTLLDGGRCVCWGWGGMSELRRFPPPGATRLGSAEWKPSEILSRTRSVSAFLLGRTSTGPRSSGEVAPSSDIPLENVERRIKQQECSSEDSEREAGPPSDQKSSLSPFRIHARFLGNVLNSSSLCQSHLSQRGTSIPPADIRNDAQLKHRDWLEIDEMLFRFACSALRAEVPLLPHDIPKRLPAVR